MSASVNDKIVDTRNAARPVSTTASGSRNAGGTSLACNSLTGWPTASKVHFVTYQIDSNSNPVAGTQLDCYGIVSGSTIGSLTVIDGTDNGNSIGDVVEMLPTAAWGQDLSDALTSTHNRSGGLKTGITLTQPTIADFTNANHTHATTAQGGLLNGANAITDGTITPAELASGTGSSWAWQAWTPSYVNLTVGNGTVNYAVFSQTGKTVNWAWKLTLGSTTSITDPMLISFPVTPNATHFSASVISVVGSGTYNDSGASAYLLSCLFRTSGSDGINPIALDSSSTYIRYVGISGTVPVTIATGDVIELSGAYEAA